MYAAIQRHAHMYTQSHMYTNANTDIHSYMYMNTYAATINKSITPAYTHTGRHAHMCT